MRRSCKIFSKRDFFWPKFVSEQLFTSLRNTLETMKRRGTTFPSFRQCFWAGIQCLFVRGEARCTLSICGLTRSLAPPRQCAAQWRKRKPGTMSSDQQRSLQNYSFQTSGDYFELEGNARCSKAADCLELRRKRSAGGRGFEPPTWPANLDGGKAVLNLHLFCTKKGRTRKLNQGSFESAKTIL
jgi:hypothetical protein